MKKKKTLRLETWLLVNSSITAQYTAVEMEPSKWMHSMTTRPNFEAFFPLYISCQTQNTSYNEWIHRHKHYIFDANDDDCKQIRNLKLIFMILFIKCEINCLIKCMIFSFSRIHFEHPPNFSL